MPYGFYTAFDWRGDSDLKNYPCWACNVAHTVPAWKPLWTRLWYDNVPYSMQWGGEMYSLPKTKGWDWRIYKGYGYITTTLIYDEEEIKRREPIFRERVGKVIDHPWEHWDNLKKELRAFYAKMTPQDPVKLSDIECVMQFCKLTGDELRRLWEIHMDCWYSLCAAGFGMFRDQIWPEFTGIPASDIKFQKILGGFDNALFQLNKRLAELGAKAVELKVDNNFKLPDEQVLPAMEQTDAGKKWLKALDDFLNSGITPEDKFGHRMDVMLNCEWPTWIEKPSLAIPHIKGAMSYKTLEHVPDVERKRLRQEGEEIEKEVTGKLSGQQKDMFKKLLTCAQATQQYSEDHDYWCEFQYFSLIRRVTKELSERIARSGAIEQPNDLYFLDRPEVVEAAIQGGRISWKPQVEARKKEWMGYMNAMPPSEEVPMILGDPSHLIDILMADPCFGVVLAMPIAKADEVGATCVGAASAPGVVEGVARVIYTSSQWAELQPGEILVAPMTDATWTPLFAMIKGVVTDSGGTLAHAAIVGREYGIPAVCGCQDATAKIKTGDKIKVDGNLCRVYVMK